MKAILALLTLILGFVERYEKRRNRQELESEIKEISSSVDALARSVANGGRVQRSDKTLADLHGDKASDKSDSAG